MTTGRMWQWMGVAALALAGCDEFAFSEEPTTDEQAYAALQAETLALRDETSILLVTPIDQLPTVGTATYQGTALIALDPLAGGTGSELIGSAEIVADFENSTVGGQADGFYGTVAGGDVTAFAGQIFLSRGEITAALGEDQISGDVNGTLQGGGDTLVVDGRVSGNFLGDPVLLNEAPAAMTLDSDLTSSFQLNGADTTGGMEIVATTD